jgi:hypothetical protein
MPIGTPDGIPSFIEGLRLGRAQRVVQLGNGSTFENAIFVGLTGYIKELYDIGYLEKRKGPAGLTDGQNIPPPPPCT